MKRLLLVCLMIVCLVPIGGFAETENHMIDLSTQIAAAELLSCGYDRPESIQAGASAWRSEMMDQLGDDSFFLAQLTREEQMRFILLWDWGAGIYDYDTGEYNLWHLMIDKNHQNRGYGKQALQACLDYIRQKPFGPGNTVRLTCHEHNIIAAALYKSLGFRETVSRDEDEVEMKLNL